MAVNQIFATFERIGATSGRLEKVALLTQLMANPEDKELLGEIVQYTYNPFWQYRITVSLPSPSSKLSSVEVVSDVNSNQIWALIKSHLDLMKSRKLTGAAARIAIDSVLIVLPEFYATWIMRIVNRDLKIGLASWDKWFPGMFPKMSPMLCDVWDGKLNGGRLMEPKLDGLRAIGVVDDDGNTTWISRNGKEMWNTELIDQEIKGLGIYNVVLDGEFFAGNFGESMSITKSQSPHKNRERLRFWLFDMLKVDEWNVMKCNRTTMERKSVLHQTFLNGTNKIVIVPSYMVTTEMEADGFLSGFMEGGFEGAVLKDPDAPYIFDRSGYWAKVKPQQEADLVIYGVEEGEGRLQSAVGAIKVQGKVNYKGRIYEIDTKVGTGLSDAVRNRMWDLHNAGQLVGKTVEIKFQEPTVVNLSSASAADTPVSAAYALRFPVFLRMREDKS
jgi:DNA ligase-1